MYAIIRTGGKQYKVQPGDVLKVEKLPKELGDEFDIEDVLLVGGEKTFVGHPQVENAKVTVVVTKQAKAPKVIVFKKKRRQGYRRMQGHRQLYTELFVKAIVSPEGEVIQAEQEAKVFDPSKKEKKKTEVKKTKKKATKKKMAKKATKKKTKSAAKKKKKKKATKKKKKTQKKTKKS